MTAARNRQIPGPRITLAFARGNAEWASASEVRPVIDALHERVGELLADLGIESEARIDVRFAPKEQMVEPDAHEVFVDGRRCRMDMTVHADHAITVLAGHIADSLFYNRALFATRSLAGSLDEMHDGAGTAAIPAARLQQLLMRAFADGLNLPAARDVANTLRAIGWKRANWPDRLDTLLALRMPQEISVELGRGQYDAVLDAPNTAAGERPIMEAGQLMRDGLFYELGVRFPRLRFELADRLAPSEFRLRVNKVRGPVMRVPVTEDATGTLMFSLAGALRRHAAEFFSAAETEAALHRLGTIFPMVVFNVLERYSLSEVRETLRALLRESVSIRDLRSILESMLEASGSLNVDFLKYIVLLARDAHPVFGPAATSGRVPPADLAECARIAIRRQVSHLQARGSSTLSVYLLDKEIEERIARTDEQPLTLAERRRLLGAMRENIGWIPESSDAPVVVTTALARRRLRAATELEFPRLAVLSFNELTPELNIQPIKRITAD